MVPSAKVFFEEVQVVYAQTATVLGLSGPVATEKVIPAATYSGGGIAYTVFLDITEGGTVGCSVETETDAAML